MNAQSKPICDTDPSRRGGIDLNAEALGDLYEALEKLEAANDAFCAARTQEQYLSLVGSGQAALLLELDDARFAARAALRKAEQVKS